MVRFFILALTLAAGTVIATGKGFDECAPISLLLNGESVPARSRSADKIVFGSAAFPPGKIPLSLVGAADTTAGTADGEVITVTLRLE